MSRTIDIHGHCDRRFDSVREEFAKNFESGEEVGASFAAAIDGRFVIDIWAGWADVAQTRPWERDTIVTVFSTTKVMTALCSLMLIDRSLLELDAPVYRYWPEFAQAGKENITIRYLLSHTAGLPAFDETIPTEAMCDWNRMVNLLAAQKPRWEPGTKCGYHAFTFGYLVGEVVRRITGKTLGTFFRDEVSIPLGASFHIGLPEEYEPLVAELTSEREPEPGDPDYVDPDSLPEMFKSAVLNPPWLDLKQKLYSSRAFRAAEIPAGNGVGNARSLARVGAALACGGELDGVSLLTLPTIEKAIEEQFDGIDQVLGIRMRYGLGFGLNSHPLVPLGPNVRTFFWCGHGGSQVVIDLDAKLSFAYTMNKTGYIRPSMLGNERPARLTTALYGAL